MSIRDRLRSIRDGSVRRWRLSGEFAKALSLMVVVVSGIVAIAAIGIFSLYWLVFHPYLKFLLG